MLKHKNNITLVYIISICWTHKRKMDASLFQVLTLCWIFCFLASDFYQVTTGFNIDLKQPMVYETRMSSYFGYAVSLHKNGNDAWLLIGAPRYRTDQDRISNGGSVFRCSPDRENYCEEISFDKTGNEQLTDYPKYSEEKSNQFMGATVYSSGVNGKIVACAPNYRRYDNESDYPVGICYTTSSNMRDFKKFSPCRGKWGTRGHCQAGISAVITPGYSLARLVMGAVGSYSWQGQVITQDLYWESDYSETDECTEENANINECNGTDYNSYMGYSMAFGEFTGGGTTDYVTGIPRGGGLKGQFAVYNQQLKLLAKITGDQIGSYFGASLAVSDFNDDGYDDIAVGAPLYTEDFGKLEETGRVYVYYQDDNHKFPSHSTLIGFTSGSRFGFSLAALSDINNDKFNDLAIGAPYDGGDRQGAVYIHLGSINGLKEEHSQVIYASYIDPGIKAFGWSLAGGLDMDGNLYPDVLVGAYANDSAVLLKTRPVINIQSNVTLEPDVVDLENKTCQLSTGEWVTCISVTTCVAYTGLGAPTSLKLDLNWNLDPETNVSRLMFYSGDERQTKMNVAVPLNDNVAWCRTTETFIKNNIRDKVTPISVDVNYSLGESILYTPVANSPGSSLIPILDNTIENTARGSAEILKNCGEDNICSPELVVSAHGLTVEHILGQNEPIELHVAVENIGENAFLALLTIELPPGTKYRRIYDVTADTPISCTPVEMEDMDIVSCDIGNPLPRNHKAELILSVVVVNVSIIEHLTFEVIANSSQAEESSDIRVLVDIPVDVVANIEIIGVSKPEQVVYNATQIKYTHPSVQKQIGPKVTHLFEVHNSGPSAISTTNVEILWPSQFEDGGHLLYLTELPKVIVGRGTCTVDTVNPEDIPVNKVDSVKSKFRRSVEVDASKLEEQSRYRLSCESTWCTRIVCDIQDMKQDTTALIQIHSHLWLASFTKDRLQSMTIISKAEALVVEMPYKIKPLVYSHDADSVSTYVSPSGFQPASKSVELWIIIVAAHVGILLLVILVVIFWKCGFFKRTRYPEYQGEIIPEQEKLNPDPEADINKNC
ncbi:unnamed protein product [Owenia fusiformis]|uniref:Integrin alpha-2 domain-containing protein n=1 Tax=Owenia fusiformis TaxID=6347 RepID=A0A8S4Q694_OWEFU|nr:unnamed protein product [Owenia fusiformis]